MSNQQIITLVKVIMCCGFVFICVGVYLHLFSDSMEEMGVTGMIISASFVAVGMAMSLPTKMFLTFVLVQHEIDEDKKLKEHVKNS